MCKAMKKLLFLLFLINIFSATAYAGVFSDVNYNTPYYDSVIYLAERGIINGYDDSTFRPDGYISRSEAATMFVRAAELPESYKSSIYKDVPGDFWAFKYIMSATDYGIISGMGDGTFLPYDKVTNNQLVKMAVCMAGLDEEAQKNGGWPSGYQYSALTNNIIDQNLYNYIKYYQQGDAPAVRSVAAYIIHNALKYTKSGIMTVGNKVYSINMSADSLLEPDEKLESTEGFLWYVYGTDSYREFFALGVQENKVVALASAGDGFSYNGYKSGDTPAYATDNLFTDKNDGGKVHGVLVLKEKDYYLKNVKITANTLYGEAKMNFHFTNAFRVHHNLKPFKWSEKAALSARLHSEDMATNNYFAHESLDGRRSSTRISAQGIDWIKCAENISGGTIRNLGFHSYDSWVNSEGHRNNLLNSCEYLGVGVAYNEYSEYTYYHTQNFYSE